MYLCEILTRIYHMERINRIKEVLVIKDKSQTWLADQIGKSRVVVSRYCNNLTQPPLDVLKDIASTLDIDIKDLLVSTKQD